MSNDQFEPETNEEERPDRESDDTLNEDELVDEQIDESFPASDPPASY
ncbi:hypothetical protein SAMN04488535_1012 [Corynebacterium mycetoides]|uniref:Uncharacterized protein n=1 Tax=Corynebacterium mycetoides TaxID=38302 RepID=A0A1G9NGT9_9CORY|nr:hypothetical protein [Corynebacterium mycetoides]SDL85563.1 hypothetical protein SAMN04488535_1012 [Corynebacterium mycetoides]